MYYFYAVAQDGEPALVLAIKHARVDLVKELLRRGANVNATSQVRRERCCVHLRRMMIIAVVNAGGGQSSMRGDTGRA